MEKRNVRIKWNNGKIACCSELCNRCNLKDQCEELEIRIQDKYEGAKDCMKHDTYKREKRRIKQKGWSK